MAEWLGHLMVGWPTWLIGIAAIAIFVVAAFIAYHAAFAINNIDAFHSERNKNGEK